LLKLEIFSNPEAIVAVSQLIRYLPTGGNAPQSADIDHVHILLNPFAEKSGWYGN
jgi:hypothetical protein